ncbi:sensor histidine kinase [Pseudoalteromonas sp. OANN1]|uniref:ATP-binding protein n=1 Tax=unclassified Pseudoalteromonas TaxID=194690 RepID=UPI00209822C5|nr:sensor histidine kinase [Pseudoalteromonas sp. OANN1]
MSQSQKLARRPKRLETRLITWVVGLCVIQACLFTALVYQVITQSLHQEVGEKALALAKAVAVREDVMAALITDRDSSQIQRLNTNVELLRQATGADFIVIGDTETRRIAHPDEQKIGRTMVGGDSQAALSGESYISTAQGSLGESIRGKVPVYSPAGEVIGLVSVGFLVQSVESLVLQRSIAVFVGAAAVLLLSVIAAIWIGRRVRQAIFGLQPDEIGRLFAEQEAILNTVRTGIIALDPDGSVRRLNQRACEILEKPRGLSKQGLHLSDLLPEHSDFLLHNPNRPLVGFELFVADKRLVLSRFALQVQGQHEGILLSMRPSDELEYVSKQLTKVQAFAELLRVQTHDYSNKLNTIGALIQMAQYDKAIELIGQESQGSQAQIENLLTYIQEPVIAGLLLGKYHKAREHNVALEVSSDSALCAIHQKEMLERIVSILGNLIDNAIEAARTTAQLRPAKVVVTVDETVQDIIFDVEDSGTGLIGNVEEAFTPQFSTKSGDQHGVGLYLVKTNLDSCHGTLEVGESELLGARITVFIPKQVKEQ